MAEYRREFEIDSAPLTGLSEEVLESTFVNCLKQEIQAELLISSAQGLGQLMDLVQRIEDKNKLLKSSGPKHFRSITGTNRG